MMETKLGKIESVKFGHGGYQEAMLGIHFVFSGKSWGVTDTKSTWDAEMIECTEYTKWTEEDRSKEHDEIIRFISKLLKKAKVHSIDKLINIPVEITFENSTLKSWRVLEEVL